MNEKNTKKIFNDFPDFWKGSESLKTSLMGFGFECGDGWFKIIHDLCKKIQSRLDKHPEYKEGFYVVQVKEKFGGLRFYTYGGDDTIYKLIRQAERKSYKTCERCGKEGKERELHHWYATLCSKCFLKWKKDGEKKFGDNDNDIGTVIFGLAKKN